MLRGEFLSVVSNASTCLPPDVLVVHLGGNDLVKQSSKSIITDIIRDLHSWKTAHPGIQIVWSTIIHRMVWRADCSPHCINKARQTVNKEIAQWCAKSCLLYTSPSPRD